MFLCPISKDIQVTLGRALTIYVLLIFVFIILRGEHVVSLKHFGADPLNQFASPTPSYIGFNSDNKLVIVRESLI